MLSSGSDACSCQQHLCGHRNRSCVVPTWRPDERQLMPRSAASDTNGQNIRPMVPLTARGGQLRAAVSARAIKNDTNGHYFLTVGMTPLSTVIGSVRAATAYLLTGLGGDGNLSPETAFRVHFRDGPKYNIAAHSPLTRASFDNLGCRAKQCLPRGNKLFSLGTNGIQIACSENLLSSRLDHSKNSQKRPG